MLSGNYNKNSSKAFLFMIIITTIDSFCLSYYVLVILLALNEYHYRIYFPFLECYVFLMLDNYNVIPALQLQRLEFLGDAVLDYLITVYLYNKYPGLSPGYLTDMRSASVNNDCYALSSVKHGLHKHILHASHELYKRINITVDSFEKLSLGSTFGWESVTSFPKVSCL